MKTISQVLYWFVVCTASGGCCCINQLSMSHHVIFLSARAPTSASKLINLRVFMVDPQFPEAIEDMLEELMPNRLTDYLYNLSETFSGFYTECKVLGSEQEQSRLLLVEATARIMRQCFSLLGITPLYRI